MKKLNSGSFILDTSIVKPSILIRESIMPSISAQMSKENKICMIKIYSAIYSFFYLLSMGIKLWIAYLFKDAQIRINFCHYSTPSNFRYCLLKYSKLLINISQIIKLCKWINLKIIQILNSIVMININQWWKK